MLGHIDLDASDNNSTSFLGKLGHKIENTIENGVNDIVDELSEKLHIHDFYSAHILDYCEVDWPRQTLD